MAEAPAPQGNVETWRSHPRLLRHLKKFRQNLDQTALLARYESKAHQLDSKSLQRHICHVGAWVALLPLEDAAQEVGSDGLSPARVLAHVLRVRGRSVLTPWLRGILHLIALRLREVRGLDLGPSATHWSELRKSIPSTVWKELRRQCPALPKQNELEATAAKSKAADSEASIDMQAIVVSDDLKRRVPDSAATTSSGHGEVADRTATRRLRLFNRTSSRWDALRFEERKECIERLQVLVEGIEDGSDASARSLREAIRTAAAAMAPPRVRATKDGAGEAMDPDSAEALQKMAQLQRRVRSLLLKAVRLWRSTWEDDTQIAPMLHHVLQLIKRFEDRSGSVGQAAAGRQWARLRECLLGGVGDSVAGATAHGSVKSTEGQPEKDATDGITKRPRTMPGIQANGVYTPNSRIQALPHVQRREVGVQLQCVSCGHGLTSNWVYRCKEVDKVLVPSAGHWACRAPYKPVGSHPFKKDTVSNLVKCAHGVGLHDCSRCGGRNICEHGRTRRKCWVCKGVKKWREHACACGVLPRMYSKR